MTHTSPTGAPNHDLFCVCLPSCFKNEALEVVTKMLPAEGSRVGGGGGGGVGSRCGAVCTAGEAVCMRQQPRHKGSGAMEGGATSWGCSTRVAERGRVEPRCWGGDAREGGAMAWGRRCERGQGAAWEMAA
jgi:hypothetical protein